MSINFYLKEDFKGLYPIKRKMEQLLIGKRSQAGLYCWNCRRTLQSSKDVYYGTEWPDPYAIYHNRIGSVMLEECPICGLKFGKKEELIHEGVEPGLIFIFALRVDEIFDISKELTSSTFYKQKTIVDENGNEYTIEEFFEILKQCPVQIIDERINWD